MNGPQSYPVYFLQIFKLDFEDGEDLEVGEGHLEHPLVLVQLLAQLVNVVQLGSGKDSTGLGANLIITFDTLRQISKLMPKHE